MKSLISAMVVLCASVSFGQQAGYIPYTPGSTGNTQVVNVDQGGIPGYQNYVQPAPPPPVGNQLPVQTWTSGLHEEFRNIHEVRPIQPWETQQVYQNQQVYVQPQVPQYTYPSQYYYQQPCCQQQCCPQYYYYPQQYYQPRYYQPCWTRW